jgi:adenylate cyclase
MEYPKFRSSVILCKFLNYIVHETISGRSNCIKEYNIAISVFQKAADFNPNQSGLVRVHARRLRDTLKEYYIHHGAINCCEIIIPKGSYIPFFRFFKSLKSETPKSFINFNPHSGDQIKIGVMPFKSFETDSSRLAMADDVSQYLSNEISYLPNLSTLSYYSTRQLHDKHTAIKNIARIYGIQFILTGSIRFESVKICVSMELVNANSEMMIWSDRDVFTMPSTDLFEVEEVIVYRAMAALKELNEYFSTYILNPIEKVERESFYKKDVIDIRQIPRIKKLFHDRKTIR